MTYFTHYRSPIGPLLLISDGVALTGLRPWTEGDPMDCQENLAVFDNTRRWLDSYFAGIPRPIDFPLAPAGTAFQKRVWDLLLAIPYGETTTYGQLAKLFGDNMSAQAIGQAVGRNPIAILIPCHRVVGAKRQLTGYAWGLKMKERLLRHEEETK